MTISTAYTRNTVLNLYSRSGFQGIGYSDGETSEQRMYAVVCAATDRSTLSLELSRSIVDWPSEYHLSRERHCLIRPLDIKPGDKVLELGCGCGAITRFLGELGAEVTAVEGSLQRGRIAGERCRDLPNIKVVVDNLVDFETPDRFQWILLVGVLEYAAVFSDQSEPVRQYLQTAAGFLAENGKLVVAIENKLGLKYFNGLAEDHFGTPFVGVQGLYGERTSRTFGRRELELQIKGAGLDYSEFYYPFPDYKLPQVIFSERALSDELFNPSDLLAMCAPRDYARDSLRSFDDALVSREVAENGLLGELSNSFLVVASRTPFSTDKAALAFTFSVNRVAKFATQTRFVRSPKGIEVIKEALEASATRQATCKDGSILRNVVGPSEYVRGNLSYWRLLVARAKQGDLAEIISAFEPWFELLLRQAVNSKNGNAGSVSDLSVSGQFLDMTPFNLIEAAQGLVAIDQEWTIDRDIPLGWVVTRSVLNSLCGTTGFERPAISVQNVIKVLCSNHGLTVSESEIADWLDREAELRALVLGLGQQKISSEVTSEAWLPLYQAAAEYESQVNSLQQIVAEQDSQIASLKSAMTERDAQIALLTRSIAERGAGSLTK